jgi:hypothetical protein
MVALGTIHDWSPAPGPIVSRHASPSARAEARQAPISAFPASYQQAQHLRGFCQHPAHGLDMARLCIGAWDIVGVCDILAMMYVLSTRIFAGTTRTTAGSSTRTRKISSGGPSATPPISCAYGEWRNDVSRCSRPIYWRRRVRCSEIASASGVFSAQTISHSL